jgi:hypothetical protein
VWIVLRVIYYFLTSDSIAIFAHYFQFHKEKTVQYKNIKVLFLAMIKSLLSSISANVKFSELS